MLSFPFVISGTLCVNDFSDRWYFLVVDTLLHGCLQQIHVCETAAGVELVCAPIPIQGLSSRAYAILLVDPGCFPSADNSVFPLSEDTLNASRACSDVFHSIFTKFFCLLSQTRFVTIPIRKNFPFSSVVVKFQLVEWY